MSTSEEIVLITRIKTNNKGNQALSAAWLAMAQRAFPGAPVRLLERRPHHLVQYTLDQLARERDPFAAFDAITTKLANLSPRAATLPTAIPPKILLDEAITPQVKLATIRQRLNLRGWIARAGRYTDAYRQRLYACSRARLVIVNPAGEFFPRNPAPAFYHLLDAHVAAKLGVPVAMVNHTMDIEDPTLRKIIPQVYKSLAFVGFRDEKSVPAFKAMGGDLANVTVTPDLALTTIVQHVKPRRPNTIGLAINVPEALARGYVRTWFDVIAKLKAAKFDVVLVSNELPADLDIYNEAIARFGVKLEGAGLDHDAYGELLGSYDFTISSRMHTLVLAMCAGTPVVPVEGSSFKITGLFQELGFAGTPVVRPLDSADWVDQIVAKSVELRTTRDAVAAETTQRISAIRDRITAGLVPELQRIANDRAQRAS